MSDANFSVRVTYGQDFRPPFVGEKPPIDKRKLNLEIETMKELPEQFFIDLANLLTKHSKL